MKNGAYAQCIPDRTLPGFPVCATIVRLKLTQQTFWEITAATAVLLTSLYFAMPVLRGSVVQIDLSKLKDAPAATTTTAGGIDPLQPCGNGRADRGEYCDDGNVMPGDGCFSCRIEQGFACQGIPSVCAPQVSEDCGNGMIEDSEMCDDGNTEADDGCSGRCEVEPGAICRGNPSVCTPGSSSSASSSASSESSEPVLSEDEGSFASSSKASSSKISSSKAPASSAPSASKPNRLRDEERDALRDEYHSKNYSSIAYERARCGDGLILDDETCDDGNATAGDGCSAKCVIEKGYLCYGTPSKCAIACGDGVIAASETCDDLNNNGGDGCSGLCKLEEGYGCKGEPSVCKELSPTR